MSGNLREALAPVWLPRVSLPARTRPGFIPLDPSIEGIETVAFNSFTMGVPTTNLKQANNTYGLNDNFSRVIGDHSLKAGFEATYEQVNVTPNPIFNGSFQFQGQETGSDFADFLIGTPFFYNQQDSQSYYIRHRYQGAYLQDSWRLRPNLTFNYGVRYDHMEFWSEKYNQIPTYILGEQSVVYPNAPPGLVYPGDPGVPNTLVPSKNRFSPRVGLAWSPGNPPGFLNKITGGAGKNQHSRGLRHLRIRDRGQRHGDRRATASLWPELYQPGAAALRPAVRGGGGTARSSAIRIRSRFLL